MHISDYSIHQCKPFTQQNTWIWLSNNHTVMIKSSEAVWRVITINSDIKQGSSNMKHVSSAYIVL